MASGRKSRFGSNVDLGQGSGVDGGGSGDGDIRGRKVIVTRYRYVLYLELFPR